MVKSARRSAFTIVELLVVISSIGVLVGLLLPAVQSAREAARRMQCSNNLRQLSLAFQNYESAFKTLPPSRITTGLSQHGFAAYLLPMIEQSVVYNLYQFNTPWWDSRNFQATRSSISTWICPTTPGNRTAPTASDQSRYVVLPPEGLGQSDYVVTHEVMKCFFEANSLPLPVGILRGIPGVIDRDRAVRMAAVRDGVSNTLLFAETAGRPSLYYVNTQKDPNATKDGWGWADPRAIGTSLEGSSSDGRQLNDTDRNAPYTSRIFGKCSINCTNHSEYYSFHTGAMQISLLDGSTRSFSQTTDAAILGAIVTRDNGEVVGEF